MQANASFVIDQSVGKNLKIELNYNVPDKTNPNFKITFPNGTQFDQTVDEKLSTFFFSIEELMEVLSHNKYIYKLYNPPNIQQLHNYLSRMDITMSFCL